MALDIRRITYIPLEFDLTIPILDTSPTMLPKSSRQLYQKTAPHTALIIIP